KDLSSLALDELIGNLKVHEVVMEKDSEIYRGKKERVNSIALKAKKEQPREEKKSFQQRDEKNGKSDWKCFRYGDLNHLIGDCPKPSRNKDQKAFIEGSWSDSENDAEDKTNDETCLMAQSSNEVCLRTCLEPDEWIKDSGCSKHMTSNKSLFSTYKAYDGGLGFDSSKASTSETKPINFVGSSDEITPDESTIKWHDLCPIHDMLTIRDITRSGFGLANSVSDCISNGHWRWPPDWLDRILGLSSILVPNLIVGYDDVRLWRDSQGNLKPFSVTCAWDSVRLRADVVDWCGLGFGFLAGMVKILPLPGLLISGCILIPSSKGSSYEEGVYRSSDCPSYYFYGSFEAGYLQVQEGIYSVSSFIRSMEDSKLLFGSRREFREVEETDFASTLRGANMENVGMESQVGGLHSGNQL
ncbi:zf-CCHC domain-containing protein, partial [Tanacetum coccineum]